jgi:hypothetical protein
MLDTGLRVPESPIAAALYSGVQTYKGWRVGETFVRATRPKDFYDVRQDMQSLLAPPPSEADVREALSEQNVEQIMMVSALNDRMVNTERAHRDLERITGRQILFITDILRPEGDHAGITDYPELQIRQFEMFLAGDFELLSSESTN